MDFIVLAVCVFAGSFIYLNLLRPILVSFGVVHEL